MDLVDPIVHSKGLHTQFVQVSELQDERFREFSAKHTKVPLLDVNLFLQFFMVFHSEIVIALHFLDYHREPIFYFQWSKTLLFYAVEGISSCGGAVNFVFFRHIARDPYTCSANFTILLQMFLYGRPGLVESVCSSSIDLLSLRPLTHHSLKLLIFLMDMSRKDRN